MLKTRRERKDISACNDFEKTSFEHSAKYLGAASVNSPYKRVRYGNSKQFYHLNDLESLFLTHYSKTNIQFSTERIQKKSNEVAKI